MKGFDHREQNETTSTVRLPHLVFALADENYAISVTHVREIVTSITLTPVPGSPNYLIGVTSLRGRILPIVDLRKRFQLSPPQQNYRPCFVILTVDTDDCSIDFGITVDQVLEVVPLQPAEVDSAIALRGLSQYIVFDKVAKTDSGLKLILDTRALVQQLKNEISSLYRQTNPSSNHAESGPDPRISCVSGT